MKSPKRPLVLGPENNAESPRDLERQAGGALADRSVSTAWRQLIDAATPENTKRARRDALAYFWTWADVVFEAEESYPVDPEWMVEFVVTHMQGLPEAVDAELVERGAKAKPGPLTVATVEARVSHLAAAHRLGGFPNPCATMPVVEALKAGRKLRARNGGQSQRQAVTRDVLDAMVATCTDGPAGDRDRALLLVGFGSGGRRRSELGRVCVEHLRAVGDDYVLHIPYSKADQEGHGMDVPCRGRVAVALRAWLDVSGIEEGPIFRRVSKAGRVFGDKGLSGQAIYSIVKKRAKLAGFDPEKFGAHSLRAGFLTEGGQRGLPLPELMALSGHRAEASAQRYYRAGDALNNRASDLAG